MVRLSGTYYKGKVRLEKVIPTDRPVKVVVMFEEEVIAEKENNPQKTNRVRKIKKKHDFSHLYGKLEWKGNALAEQKKIRSEWQ